MRRWLLLLFALLVALLPVAASAQANDADLGGFMLRVNGDLSVGAKDALNNAVVVRGNAVIDGAIRGNLVVVNGDATVRGSVDGTVVMIDGTLTLAPSAHVRDIALVRGSLSRESGATITGSIRERSEITIARSQLLFGFMAWLGATFAVLMGGLLFAAVGGRQLRAGTVAMTEQVGPSVIAALIVFIGVPIVGVLSIFTIIGAPFGIAVLFLVLPALLFLGYLTSGALLGSLILNGRATRTSERPYREVLLGLGILQLFMLAPFVGVAVGFGAAWGAGGLAVVGSPGTELEFAL